MYASIKGCLGKHITEPPGLPNIMELQLVNLFTAASTPDMRAIVLRELCKENTNLRLIIATSAFGLGVDCPDIVIYLVKLYIGEPLVHLKNWYSKVEEVDRMDEMLMQFYIMEK